MIDWTRKRKFFVLKTMMYEKLFLICSSQLYYITSYTKVSTLYLRMKYPNLYVLYSMNEPKIKQLYIAPLDTAIKF